MSALEKRLVELRQMAKDYAKAQSERVYLDEFRKSQLAILQKRHMRDFDSVAAQEREARADPEYLTVLKGLKEATEKAERLKWELQIAMAGASLWQTEKKVEISERRAYGA